MHQLRVPLPFRLPGGDRSNALNLAVFAPDRASDIISAYPDIHSWVIGGHSLGGSMAANFARNNPSLVKGLFFGRLIQRRMMIYPL